MVYGVMRAASLSWTRLHSPTFLLAGDQPHDLVENAEIVDLTLIGSFMYQVTILDMEGGG